MEKHAEIRRMTAFFRKPKKKQSTTHGAERIAHKRHKYNRLKIQISRLQCTTAP